VTFAAAAALIASLMPLGARYGWVFDLAANFRVQYVVVDALLVVACAFQRKPLWCLALAACAVLSARPVLPYVALPIDAVAAAPVSQHTIKILSANVLFVNHSAKRLLEIVREESPDIVLLVEYTPEWAAQVDELRAAYPYRLEGPVKSPWGIALFSRLAFDSSKAIPVGPSYGVQASVLTPDGPLLVIGTHFAQQPARLSRGARRARDRTGSRRRRLEHHAVLAVVPRLARTHRAHRHSPRAHAQPQLAGAVADRRRPDRSLCGEPRRRDRPPPRAAGVRLGPLSDSRRARARTAHAARARAVSGKKGRSLFGMSQPTACILIIGNEILSGKTQDANIQFLGFELAKLGIRLEEARVVRDVPEAIVRHLNECRAKFTYVFTTGGIGPTHDDITAECVALAFGVELVLDPEAVEILKRGGRPLNDARLKMARVPRGAELVANSVSGAPGFRIDNVFVFAGIPSIARAMFASAVPMLVKGSPILSASVDVYLREGDFAEQLTQIQSANAAVEIGSYPFNREGRLGATLVVRGTDRALIDRVAEKIVATMAALGGETKIV
jgi:molybdopterin-biosynthesis enzyme MoeA-like protein